MRGFKHYMPALAMVLLQFTYAGLSLSTRVVLLQGMSPRVYVVYRQAVATAVMAPIAFFSSKKLSSCSLNLRGFTFIFLASLGGVTINQNAYYEGLYLVSSSVASAMSNLIPAITLLIAALAGMEKVNIGSLRSIAKIVGTVICVSGAVSMAMLKGATLLNAKEQLPLKSVMSSAGQNWLLGCLFLFGSACFWSIWLILQVPASASHPNHLSLSAWMCFMATLQSAAVTAFLEPDPETWKMHSVLELGCVLYSGLAGSALSFFIQAWCISKRGPLFSAMFNPLCTVIVTIFAAMFLHEEIYTGSLIGSIGVIIGLYVVLWGKAGEAVEAPEETENECYENDMEEPLLSTKSP